jgi:hypothetical protein
MSLLPLLLLPSALLGREDGGVDPVSDVLSNSHELRSGELVRGQPGELPRDGGQRLGLDLGRDRCLSDHLESRIASG